MSIEASTATVESLPLKLDFSVRTVTPTNNFLGFAKLTINEAFVIDNLRILQSENGIYAGMPSVPDPKRPGKYNTTAFPITPDVRLALNAGLEQAYFAQIEKDQNRLVAIMANSKERMQKPSLMQTLKENDQKSKERFGSADPSTEQKEPTR